MLTIAAVTNQLAGTVTGQIAAWERAAVSWTGYELSNANTYSAWLVDSDGVQITNEAVVTVTDTTGAGSLVLQTDEIDDRTTGGANLSAKLVVWDVTNDDYVSVTPVTIYYAPKPSALTTLDTVSVVIT